MARQQLHILAIEPYFGGFRRAMLEALQRSSRHHWTLLKLPPRRLERRITTSAVWFAEVLSRNGIGRCDVLFASDTLSLQDFISNLPEIGRTPSVLYCHENYLPPEGQASTGVAVANLNSATSADEVWFNSVYHLRTFLARAGHLISQQDDLQDRSPLPEISAKSQVVSPPVATQHLLRLADRQKIFRKSRRLLVDLRAANFELLAKALRTLESRHEAFEVDAIGLTETLTGRVPTRSINPEDESAIDEAILSADIYLSTKIGCAFDDIAVRVLATGGQTLLPQNAAYSELLPPALHATTLHDHTEEMIVARVQDLFHLERPRGHEFAQEAMLKRFDPATATRVIDQKIEQLAVSRFLDDDVPARTSLTK